MPNLYLTQTDLNQSLRGVTDVNIVMLVPDKNVVIPSNAVTSNVATLSYTTNLQSVVEFSTLPQANIATFENNSWILDGSFMSPSEQYGGGGDSYSGYISNAMTDDNGNYTTNPIITVQLASLAEIEYMSLFFIDGIDTSYPKSLVIRTYDSSSELIREHTYDLTQRIDLPLLVAEVADTSVNKISFEFIGTQAPHRRTRLNKIMFGKAEQVNNHYLQSWKVDDKASLVADSIPTKTLTYSIIDYNRTYDIDNPGNKIPNNLTSTLVFFDLFVEDDHFKKYMPTKTFNLLDISTTSEGVVTFTCGSILDTLTMTYDREIYNDAGTTLDILMLGLLAFAGVPADQVNVGEFGAYKINVPIPELPVREIIQRLAFSCGATLTVNDNNIITFSKKNIQDTTNSSKFMFNQPIPFTSAGVLLEEPKAEALEHTTNISMYTYDTVADTEITEVTTVNIETNNLTRISFPAVAGGVQFDERNVEEQHAQIVRVDEAYSQHALIQLAIDSQATLPITVKVLGRKTTITKTMPKQADMDTLLLDSGMAYQTQVEGLRLDDFLKPRLNNPNPNTFYYTDWYGAKFKYVCKTRNEYLVKAGDIILFETPFSNKEANRKGYVLRNTYSNDGSGGEMEVIAIDN